MADNSDEIRKKLTSIKNLEEEYEKLKVKKQNINSNDIEPLKGYLYKYLENENKSNKSLKVLEWNKFQVKKVAKKQQRAPTLKMTYDAIEKILGEKELKEVKAEIKKIREERKRKAVKTSSIVMVRIGEKRKTRKDKYPPEKLKQNKQKKETKVKKPFTKRAKKSE
jgi:hypothetical protein